EALTNAAEEAREYGINVLNANALYESMVENRQFVQGAYPELDAHAGEIETALYLWKFPHLVRKEKLKNLPDNWAPLRKNLQDGAKDFVEAGGLQSYFGSPAKATAETGKKSYD